MENTNLLILMLNISLTMIVLDFINSLYLSAFRNRIKLHRIKSIHFAFCKELK